MSAPDMVLVNAIAAMADDLTTSERLALLRKLVAPLPDDMLRIAANSITARLTKHPARPPFPAHKGRIAA